MEYLTKIHDYKQQWTHLNLQCNRTSVIKRMNHFYEIFKNSSGNIYSLNLTYSDKDLQSLNSTLPEYYTLSRETYLHRVVALWLQSHPHLKIMTIREYTKQGYPHYHGIIHSEMPIKFTTLEQTYPYQCRFRIINQIDKWSEYCAKGYIPDDQRRQVKSYKKVIKQQINNVIKNAQPDSNYKIDQIDYMSMDISTYSNNLEQFGIKIIK